MSEQDQCISDGEEQVDDCFEVPDFQHGTIRKNLFEDFAAGSKRSSPSSDREFMKVYLRIRPFDSEEILTGEDQQCIEIENQSAVLTHAPNNSFTFKNSTRGIGEVSHRFTFSSVFSPDTTQKAFFDDTALGMVKDFIDGQNCLLFTYGVTKSGKTYTIQGTPKDGGVLPRTLDVLFNSIGGRQYHKTNLKPKYFCDVMRLDSKEEQVEQAVKAALMASLEKEAIDLESFLKLEHSADISKASSSVASDLSSLHSIGTDSQVAGDEENSAIDFLDEESRIADDTTVNVDTQGPIRFSIWVSFAEIYNEIIYDLLEPCPTGKGKKRTALKIGDDKSGHPYIKGLREVCVLTADEAYKILKIGQKNQKIASTKLNHCSSRSHCVFTVKVLRVMDVDDPHVARVSKLSFVDLAGSERYTKTNSKGARLKEAGNINTSLMTLGKCLDNLRYNQHHPSNPLIIPFRESKLTRLFQAFFCGQGRASMIVNVSKCASMFDETFHVMKFSAIAKQVTTRVAKPTKQPQEQSKPSRESMAWATETLCKTDKQDTYTQQLQEMIMALQEQLVEEKRKFNRLELDIRAEVCTEMAAQLVEIEEAYSERVQEEVTAVEEKCDRRMSLLIKSVKKKRIGGGLGVASREDLLQQQLKDTQEKLDEATDALKKANRNIQGLEEEISMKDGFLVSSSTDAAELKTRLEIAQALRIKDRQTEELLQAKLKEAEETIVELERQMEVRCTCVGRGGDYLKLDEEMASCKPEEEQGERNGLENCVEKFKAELKGLEKQLEESTKALDKKNAQLIARNTSIKRLEALLVEKENVQVKESNRELRLEKQLSEITTTLGKVNTELMARERDIINLEASLVEKEKATASSREKEVEKQLNEMTTTLGKVNTELMARDQVIVNLEASLAEKDKATASSQEKEVEKQLNEMTTTLGKVNTELMARDQVIVNLEASFAEKEKAIASSREAEQLLEVMTTGLAQAAELMARDRVIESLKASLAEKEEVLESSRKENLNKVNAALKKNAEGEQEKEQELSGVREQLLFVQGTIEQRNLKIDELENKLHDQRKSQDAEIKQLQIQTKKLISENQDMSEKLACLEKEKKKLSKELAERKEERRNLEEALTARQKIADVLQEGNDDLQKAVQEHEVVIEAQGIAVEEERREVRKLTRDIGYRDQKITRMEGQIDRLKLKQQELENKCAQKDAELSKGGSSGDEMLKDMREAYQVTKAQVAEYKARMIIVHEQVEDQVKKKYQAEIVSLKKQLRDKERDIQVPRQTRSKTSDSSDSSVDCSQMKRKSSSELTLAEVKAQLSAKKQKPDSDDDFTPSSVTKTKSRGRSASKQKPLSARKPRTALALTQETKSHVDLSTPSSVCNGTENKPPRAKRRLQKKETLVLDYVAGFESAKEQELDPATKIMTRQLRSRSKRT